ncbi:MAG: hypothetical protein ACOYL6_11720 [Bacteriovoracaceae bacterium]
MKSILLGLALTISISPAFASSQLTADGFHKRFQLVRNDQGELLEIRDRTIDTKFSLKPYLKQIKENLISMRDYINEHKDDSVVNDEVDSILADLNSDGEMKNSLNEKAIKDSVNVIGYLDVDGLMAAIQKPDVLAQYESRLTQEMSSLSLNSVANLRDSRYFYKRAVTYKVVTWALDYAKKHFSQIPLLNTVSYVIVEVEKMIRERRTFHQNMLLHYFENFSEKELGMTKEEVDLAFSSIYESRIAWSNPMESSNAVKSWKTYGTNIFFSGVRAANTKVRNMSEMGTDVKARYNYAFLEVMDNGERVVLNLFNNKHMFSFKPAIAYNYAKPMKVKRTRQILSLAQIGISFIPVSDGIKNFVNQFIDSTKENQALTEGALIGYFESNGNTEMYTNIKSQILNPYDTF